MVGAERCPTIDLGVEASAVSRASIACAWACVWAPTPFMDSPDVSRLLLPIRPTDHVRGPEDAPYTLVEYGDYECPDCGRLYVILRDLQQDIASRLRIVFRHYPLSGVHPHAQQAAEAAQAAGAQGKFWEMHTLLFERQQALRTKDLIRYAEELTLDVERFRDELKKETYSERVRADFLAGVQNGVYGTPGLFLNGVRYDGEWDGDSLRRLLVL
jgi:protein-disulfide isomerase